MATNDEGEFELILGNRQLVSVFLIVVILLGAFFSMGYLVGRSSSSSVVSAENTHGENAAKPIVVDSATRNPPPVETPVIPKPSPVETRPVETPRQVPQAVVPQAAPPKTQPPTEPVNQPSGEEPRAGQTFLQVVATTRPDAEIVAESLAKKGFHTRVVPGPSSALFRVVVGPVGNAADLAETRVKLEAAGFKPYVRRY